MKFLGVRFLETTAEGQILTDILYLDSGKTLHRNVARSRFSAEIADILKSGYTHANRLLTADMGEVFLRHLKFRYSGSYFRASDVEALDLPALANEGSIEE